MYRNVQILESGFINTTTGKNWIEIAKKLGRLGKWEFEDQNYCKNYE